jgi:hypothetical protein
MLGRAATLLDRLEEERPDTSAPVAESASGIETDGRGGASAGIGVVIDESAMDIDIDDQNTVGRIISQMANAASAAGKFLSVRHA